MNPRTEWPLRFNDWPNVKPKCDTRCLVEFQKWASGGGWFGVPECWGLLVFPNSTWVISILTFSACKKPSWMEPVYIYNKTQKCLPNSSEVLYRGCPFNVYPFYFWLLVCSKHDLRTLSNRANIYLSISRKQNHWKFVTNYTERRDLWHTYAFTHFRYKDTNSVSRDYCISNSAKSYLFF